MRAPKLSALVSAFACLLQAPHCSAFLRGSRLPTGTVRRDFSPLSSRATPFAVLKAVPTLEAETECAYLAGADEFLKGIDVIVFDCDGVIWRGDSVIPGIPDVLDKLRALGKRLFFVTNNSTKSRKGYKKKFTDLGLDVQDEEIFSSSFAAAAYFEQTKFKETGKKVYVVGETGIEEELDLVGVPWIGATKDKDKKIELKPGAKLEIDPQVGAVCVGFDRNINYYKLQYAQLAINENKAQFIATNLDAVTHLTDAQEWAGNGSMVGAIKGCTGKEPTVVGKPAPLMIDYIVDKYKVQKNRILMVGDRLDTDIAFGRNNGLRTVLTLSGVTSPERLRNTMQGSNGSLKPEYFVESINDFFK
uniref:Phosphoglycolate phosphatase n=1 Tax=Chromera velia CCMP2878 TaxID=1169474 RepID=A0A0G4HDR1_9ALVE|mmetsp:Transcript_41544/g.81941  ORF Transcript_41544/g.81941 Transcript_41544/m.81941 type:complete len:360 (-) Transcript_41544:587-1666(-)|eukprot:Cvel_6427.t1-p1 / transcript=Cvel_6427.t1 / gene=Cvel_6427 / organism=Chromera_velia_CCMP2878 / gene_product=Phosphoglycolate phosphatase 1B, chloroplastic, putative / transcript_product=Phosphoglycolate phosphatase 1B, chloroplastic, putative / location=Cvel_scaffold314:70255-72301(-) / protein_length=359 / sequence_SO=supercontig / SO=protein_coding / is_pseudo=false